MTSIQSLLSEAVESAKREAQRLIEQAESEAQRKVREAVKARAAELGTLPTRRVYFDPTEPGRSIYNCPYGHEIPRIPDLDERILALIDNGTDEGAPTFEMGTWHGNERNRDVYTDSRNASSQQELKEGQASWCGTTHCLAGWAVHLAGLDGYALARAFDDEAAGAAIFLASTGSLPYFYASNEAALREMRERVLANARRKYAPETGGAE